jgi:CheY-like chemotaxis protein
MMDGVHFQQIKILLVDDDPDIRGILAERLAEIGYGVTEAANGEEALQALHDQADLRMMITDVRMPGISGLELARLATERRADLKIILISGYFLPQPIDQRFLKKPFRLEQLETAVRAELGS